MNGENVKILELFKEKIRNLENSKKMLEYDEIINQKGTIEQDKIKDFMRELKIFRLKNGRIPKKYYDYILKETILGNIDKMEFEDAIKNCLIDMEKDKLEKVGVKNYKIGFMPTKEGTGGEHSTESKSIILSQTDFENESIIQIVNNLFHEGRHAEQEVRMNENIDDFKFYKMLKEKIIRQNDFMSYFDNYYDSEVEFDARISAAIQTYNYLLEIGVPIEKISSLSGNLLENEIANNINHNRDIKEYHGRFNKINEIFVESFRNGISLEGYLNPDYKKDILRKYPILQIEFEYSDSGEIVRKSNEQIMGELNEKIKSIEDENEIECIRKFYERIIGDNQEVKDDKNTPNTNFLEKNGYEVSDALKQILREVRGVNQAEEIVIFASKCYRRS